MSETEPTTPNPQADPEQDPGTGSGEGGSLGTRDDTPEEPWPADEEPNKAVSGGGVVPDNASEIEDSN